jgi:glutamate-ammonia-ligase adenylyltransferase
MGDLGFLFDHVAGARLPEPAEPARVALGAEQWEEALSGLDPETAGDGRAFQHSEPGRRLFAALFGNSPFLAQCCLRDPAFVVQLLRHGPDATFTQLLQPLNDDSGADREIGGEAELMRRLRVAKRRAALVVAVADIAGAWPLERVTQALSAIAEAALGAAVRHLLREAHRAGHIELAFPDEPERDSGLIVLGMGKLGAGELNYSSDIDLILLYDLETVRYTGRTSPQQFFPRLGRDLVRLLDQRTADGYVFRTDLRLRPDPASTPPAVSVQAALTYYESTGQNWERAALIKARPVAGDRAAGDRFLQELRPFLWRKNLDFAAIQDIHSIKRQINAHKGGAEIAVYGHNVKLGRGGIREIEFFAQTQQLIWGGRIPAVRRRGTAEALRSLAAEGRITAALAEAMIEAYRFLRVVEHRLQMVEDQQTHTLPADPAALGRIAVFLGYRDGEEFGKELCRVLALVERNYAELFEEAPTLSSPGNLVFTGAEDDPETLATLTGLGFHDPSAVSARIRGWHHGRYRATRSQRAREILTELVPGLVEAFGKSPNPDAAFLRFDRFLGHLPAGVQLLSLLHQNPGLLGLLAEIMGAAPRIADHLARYPIVLDAVLTEGFLAKPPSRDQLEHELAQLLVQARDYQDVLDLARRWTNDRKFQIGLQMLRGMLDGDEAGAAFADVAETVIAGLLPEVEREFARQHGRVPGGAMVVLALGKCGGREMTATSDLDLILVYDAPAEAQGSDGPRPLPVSTYYARLSARLINALTALTGEGLLYEVDTRLRPSGSSGPAASSFEAFAKYHDGLAWTWEQMALTRARPVAGPASLAGRVMEVIRRALTQKRDERKLLLDVAEMRQRIAASHANPPFWDVKHRRGGMVDAEFIAQYLELRHAECRPEVLHPNTTAALEALAAAGGLGREDADALAAAMRLWRQVQGLVKLLVEGEFDEATAPEALKATLARSARSVDFACLKGDMEAVADRVRRIYDAIIDRPAADTRQETSEEKAR